MNNWSCEEMCILDGKEEQSFVMEEGRGWDILFANKIDSENVLLFTLVFSVNFQERNLEK